MRLKKSILLNCLLLTAKKEQILDSFFAEYFRVLNETLKYLPEAKSSTELHHLTYSDIRNTSFLPSDIIQEARTYLGYYAEMTHIFASILHDYNSYFKN